MNPKLVQSLSIWVHPDLQTFKTMFVSITLEAFPFILLGVLISSIIQVFVPESFIRRMIPRNPVLGVVTASLLGIVFPVCECGMVPVARRLIRKGFPVYAAVAFLLAGPIVNPVVYSATFMAFRSNPSITYSRMAMAVIVAVIAGLLIYRFVRWNPMKREAHPHHDHSHHHAAVKGSPGAKLIETFDHAAGEFFDMGKYLIFGAFLTALVQTFVPRSIMLEIAQNDGMAHVFMMGFAYILSICSTSDAFVASSFSAAFSAGPLLAFLVFGPMLDVKSTLMLLSAFKARFVILLASIVFTTVWGLSIVVGRFI